MKSFHMFDKINQKLDILIRSEIVTQKKLDRLAQQSDWLTRACHYLMNKLELQDISAVFDAIAGLKADVTALSELIDGAFPELNAGTAGEAEAAADAASLQQLRSQLAAMKSGLNAAPTNQPAC